MTLPRFHKFPQADNGPRPRVCMQSDLMTEQISHRRHSSVMSQPVHSRHTSVVHSFHFKEGVMDLLAPLQAHLSSAFQARRNIPVDGFQAQNGSVVVLSPPAMQAGKMPVQCGDGMGEEGGSVGRYQLVGGGDDEEGVPPPPPAPSCGRLGGPYTERYAPIERYVPPQPPAHRYHPAYCPPPPTTTYYTSAHHQPQPQPQPSSYQQHNHHQLHQRPLHRYTPTRPRYEYRTHVEYLGSSGGRQYTGKVHSPLLENNLLQRQSLLSRKAMYSLLL
ncbi:hypothetical protein AAG570_005605 [Ranatra chinensis]|uniref:Uncharacterized protein n=1 Tax=Ranatra chinensis TaxID=642074 RepID=A0ABD0Y0H1_9HEMI